MLKASLRDAMRRYGDAAMRRSGVQIRDNKHGHRIDSLAMMCVAPRKASLASWRWSMVMRIPRNYRPVKRTNFNAMLVDGLHHITFSIHSIQTCMTNAVEYGCITVHGTVHVGNILADADADPKAHHQSFSQQ